MFPLTEPPTHQFVVDAAGIGIASAANGTDYCAVFIFTVPMSPGQSQALGIIAPHLDEHGLRKFAEVANAIADAKAMNLDLEQARALIEPIVNAALAGEDDPTAPIAARIDKPTTAEAMQEALDTRNAMRQMPAASTECMGCGRRIFGERVDLGTCTTCEDAVVDLLAKDLGISPDGPLATETDQEGTP